ncbi:MAG TPA: ABC transporter ATP-binding protein [Chthoniobacteraceae bacterium]|nr:ABC transporter ATP-binding protein [Chthoniobacteraceae bacterium]
MSSPAIRVENLGKKYRIRHQQEGRRYKSLREILTRKAASVLNPKAAAQPASEDFWALRDVSFEIGAGEAVGIIGRNGAGKSTLLKLLSRITEPSAGRIELEGRVSSLLEVGTGFHPELTGRENIYLNGAILGMSGMEIKRRFDEIVAFAEVEKFLDTPVKRYSSGMYMRLAFSVAAHLEPEILIVDEVLAVGDAAFQKKCLGRMREVSTQGRTVLFVSHNMGAITSLCQKAFWLDSGGLAASGPVRKIVDQYLTASADATQQKMDLSGVRRSGDSGSKMKITGIEWLTGLPFKHGESLSARIHFQAFQDVEDIAVGFGFSNIEGIRLLSFDTDFQDSHRPSLKRGASGWVDFHLPELILAPGFYSLDIGIRSGDSFGLDYLPAFCQMEIAMGPKTPGYIAVAGAGVRVTSQWDWAFDRAQAAAV